MAVVVTGAIKDYPWGMIDGMVPWTGRGTGRPQAELWFGVHPSGPSPTLDGSTADIVLADRDVPLLVKILAAGQPLSIQVHPDAEQASKGFANQPPGVRVYADAAEKVEMLVAMTEFQALAGWRHPDSAAEVLAALGYSSQIREAAAAAHWADAARMIMAGRPDDGPWDPGRVRRALADRDPAEAAAIGDVAAVYQEDPGVGIAAILAYHRLAAGDALYMPTGVPHAFLRGVGVEVMTSSDNVLRLGLTSKEIAVEEALGTIRPEFLPQVLSGPGPKEPGDAPFRATLQRAVTASLPQGQYRVVLAIDGAVDVVIGERTHRLEIGQAALIPAEDPQADVTTDAMVALVEAVDRG